MDERTTIRVIKVSGHQIDDPVMLTKLANELAAISCPVVLVHGGGKEISAAFERSGQAVSFRDGIRITPPESMAIMEMVVCGSINKRLVAALVNAGCRAIGLSGVDLGLLRSEPYRPGGQDFGRVGVIRHIRTDELQAMLAHGWMPVIAPVALGHDDGVAYNINADMVTQAIAIALAQASVANHVELVFVSNVPGIIIDEWVVSQLSIDEAEKYIHSGQIIGGMIPKVRGAQDAIRQGVASVRITDFAHFAAGGTSLLIGEVIDRPARGE